MGNQNTLTYKRVSRKPFPDGYPLDTTLIPNPLSVVCNHINQIQSRRLRPRVIENFLIIWLDATINQWHGDIKYSFDQLQKLANTVKTFTKVEQCRDFIKTIEDERIFLISSGSCSEKILASVAHLSSIESIYIFCRQKSHYKLLPTRYPKIKDICEKIEPICELIRADIRRTESVFIPKSIIQDSTNPSNNELDRSLMYSQLLKEILLEFDYDAQAKENLIQFCRTQYADNQHELLIIDEFEQHYDDYSPIWWYTRECFTYSMLNKALRTHDIEVIMQMGWFIRDLHQQIESLHRQANIQHPFIVYRGQGVSSDELEKFQQSQGSLSAFNNFLSTSTEREVALEYTRRIQETTNLTAILFQMHIDPSICSTPFASLDHVSFYSTSEKEILFSMHTVFRIKKIDRLGERLWQVKLEQTADHDPHLTQLTHVLRRDIEGETRLHQLAALMAGMGQYNKAEEIYSLILEKTSPDDTERLATLHYHLGRINDEKGDMLNAKCHYECSVRLTLTDLSADHPLLSTAYSNIGMILQKEGDLDTALKRLKFALKLDFCDDKLNHVKIALRQNNIALVLREQQNYSEAIKYHQRALSILLDHLPSCHPDLAQTYKNMGIVYHLMDQKSTALSCYRKTLAIEQRSLLANHPKLANTHHCIAKVFEQLEQLDQAIEHARSAVNISQDSNHEERLAYQTHLDYLLSLLDESSVL